MADFRCKLKRRCFSKCKGSSTDCRKALIDHKTRAVARAVCAGRRRFAQARVDFDFAFAFAVAAVAAAVASKERRSRSRPAVSTCPSACGETETSSPKRARRKDRPEGCVPLSLPGRSLGSADECESETRTRSGTKRTRRSPLGPLANQNKPEGDDAQAASWRLCVSSQRWQLRVESEGSNKWLP